LKTLFQPEGRILYIDDTEGNYSLKFPYRGREVSTKTAGGKGGIPVYVQWLLLYYNILYCMSLQKSYCDVLFIEMSKFQRYVKKELVQAL